VTWLRMPLAPVAGAFAAGIALAPIAPPAAWWSTLAVALGATGGLLLRGWRLAAVVAALAAVAALGAVRALAPALPADHVARLGMPPAAHVEGRLAEEPTRWAIDRTRLLLDVERVDGVPRSGLVQVTAYGEAPPLAEGQRLGLEARLHPALGFRNPGTFDLATHLARDDIFVVATARAERITPLAPAEPPWHSRVKRRALDAMAATLPPVSAALLGGLLLGERVDLPPDVNDAFRRAGVYHILAVSGFNVALLASSVWAVLALAAVSRRVAAAAAIVVVVGFAAVVGPEPSVVRATIMAVLVLIALLLERDASVTNGLALAALVVLAVRPGDLADPGFQLSFAATAGIVAAPAPRGAVLGALAVSLAAQVAVLPITLAHFNQVSLIGVIANLGVVPVAGFATVLGLLAVAVAFVSEAAGILLFDAVWPALLLLRALVRLAADVPGAVVHLPAPGPAAIACYAAGIVAALVAWRSRDERPDRACRLFVASALLLVTAAALEAWPMVRPADGRLHVTVLDVGQGDAIVIETPEGRAVLVDAGAGGPSRLDIGERVVAPFLWNRGFVRLAATMVTHADIDHAGGMPAVHRLFAVSERWDEMPRESPFALGGARFTVLRPPAVAGARRNDTSLVLRVDYGLASFLLASDIEAPAEAALVAAHAPVAATVLKVAHHGSRTSTTPSFVAAVKPAVAVVSVGARHTYGHPDPGPLARLAEAGAVIARTDEDGAVLLASDGRALDVTRWAARSTARYCLDPETIC
jgi:competence protein ComEC